ncbi:MAG: molybdopterin-dependent oxidoreductase [Rhodospirillaceae bacterium]|nr:molybdopterin-dependent oxidoreductase [Rhodospirillaceae bacterium]
MSGDAAAVRTTCPYCGVGCGVLATVRDDGSVAIAGDPDHPANRGRLCAKGSALAETLGLDDRLLHPIVDGVRATWDAALDRVAGAFGTAIRDHGPNSVAFYVSGQILTEDYYVANKLMKGFIGSANIDTNSRLCMASSVAGHKRAFGSDTVPGLYEDLELADLVVLVGSNLAWCHPVLYQRLAAAKAARPQMRVVVVDPRRTATTDIADRHLAIAPGSDIPLFLGLLDHLDSRGALDAAFMRRHVAGAAEAVAAARRCGLFGAARATGLAPAELTAFYDLVAATPRTVTVYSQGVNQSVRGTDKVNAILNVHLATGRIGRPGMGPFSVTGQPNAMGGREVGGLANQLAAHMDLGDPHHRDIVQSHWASPRIADRPGLKAVDLFRAVADGRIKALLIMGTNPVDSLPDADGVRAALKACPFVAVADVTARTDTAACAHVLLPAAAWGEKDGTVTNSERRISRQRRFLPPPGEARPDWWILCRIGQRLGHRAAFDHDGPGAIFREYAALTARGNDGSRGLDLGGLAGLDRHGYDALAPTLWPVPADGQGATRFFADGRFHTPDGKARMVAVEPDALAPPQAAGRPFILNTGRVRDHWHTMTRTAKSPRLSQFIAEPYVEIAPADAQALALGPADLAVVENDRGRLLLRVLVSDRQRPGSVFVPMHWTDQLAARARVDSLVPPAVDPVSGQPGSKSARVSVRRFAAAWYAFAVVRHRPARIDAAYWAAARTDGGWRIELAGDRWPEDWQALAAALFGTSAEACVDYRDPSGGRRRVAVWDDRGLVGALFAAAQPVAVSRSWAASWLTRSDADAVDRQALLAGRAGDGADDPGPTICACLAVGANRIRDAVVTIGCTTVVAVGEACAAGTNCGSCRGEIQRIINDARLSTAV